MCRVLGSCLGLAFAVTMSFSTPAGGQSVARLKAENASLRKQIDSLKAVISTLRNPTEEKAQSSRANGRSTVFRSGKWSVVRNIDKMTDEPSCTAIFNNEWTVQMSDEGFYVSYRGRGGVRAVTLRYGDDPAQPLRLATETESSVSAVILDGYDLQKVLSAHRLRVQVMTVLDRVLTDDIDLTGAREAHTFITTDARCQAK